MFSHADWSMLERMESDSYASNLATTVGSLAIKNLSPDDDTASYRSDLVMKLASLLRNQPRRNRLSQLPTLSSQYRFVIILEVCVNVHFSVVLFI